MSCLLLLWSSGGVTNTSWSCHTLHSAYVPWHNDGEDNGIAPVDPAAANRAVGFASCGGRLPASYKTYAPLEPFAYVDQNARWAAHFRNSRRARKATVLKSDDNVKAVRRICTVTDYNTTGDGKTFDTAAIDAALHDCAGGGVVVLPGPNTFLTAGGHVLRSNMGLEVQAGAVLLQSPDPSKGSAANTSIPCGNAPVPHFAGFSAGCAMLSAQNASNVSIYGAGAIRGAGAPNTCWNYAGGTPFANLLKFAFIHNLRIFSVSLQNPCGWTVHPQHCRDVAIQNITISCEPVQYHYNTDGIDPDSCVDVLIEDLNYSCGDDAVAVKASYPGCQPTRNITIRRLKSGGRGGLTIGSEVQGGAVRELSAFLEPF